MGLDVYAGTLTRYYSQDWKTVVQQWTEANGYKFHIINPQSNEDLEPQPDASPDEIHEGVVAWQNDLIKALNSSLEKSFSPWSENTDTPYYTNKPDWDAFGALLLVAACCSYHISIPETVEKDWDFWENPIIMRLANDKDKVWSLLRGADWWLPLSGSFCFTTTLPNEQQTLVGTLGGLEKELTKINDMAWQADEATIISWAQTQGYPVEDKLAQDGSFSKMDLEPDTTYNTQSLAKFAYSILYQSLKFAQKHQVPIILDY